MKFSLFSNDKSTILDEIIIGILSVLCLVAGTLLIIFRPEWGIIEPSMSVVAGFMMDLFGGTLIPCMIYRLFTNDKKK